MTKKVNARLEWIPGEMGGRKAPPSGPIYASIVRFEQDNWPEQAWSIIIDMMKSQMWFLVENSPQERLVPGAAFEICEGDKVVARGEVLEQV